MNLAHVDDLTAELVYGHGAEPYSDLTVVNAARVSYAKHRTVIGDDDQKLMEYLEKHGHWSPFSHVQISAAIPLSQKFNSDALTFHIPPNSSIVTLATTERRVWCLVRCSLYGWAEMIRNGSFIRIFGDNGHKFKKMIRSEFPMAMRALGDLEDDLSDFRPFVPGEGFHMPVIDGGSGWFVLSETDIINYPKLSQVVPGTFRMNAPIFTARQLIRHPVGVSWNEESRRYIKDDPVCYWPDEWRLQSKSSKQGSSGAASSDLSAELNRRYANQLAMSDENYQFAVDNGVAMEMARMFLPVSLMTGWYWTASLFTWARICRWRMDPHTQLENQYSIRPMAKRLEELWPELWPRLMVDPHIFGRNVPRIEA